MTPRRFIPVCTGINRYYYINSYIYRFIPVCTGNTVVLRIRFPMTPIYPCAYRELDYWSCGTLDITGLSLCIQGTHTSKKSGASSSRFIPVHTGNTRLDASAKIAGTVYPCAYREHPKLFDIWVNPSGLSLCIQGTPLV